MEDPKFALLGPAYDKVGQEAVQLAGGEPDKLFLYVEIGDGWVGPSLYKDEGPSIRYVEIEPASDLFDLIEDAWCLEPSDKRWTSMRYEINNGSFRAEFDFDEPNPEDASDDRRERVLRARYGDRPVMYPPLPADGWVLKPPA